MRRQFSAGGIVFKRDGDGVEWLIRRPKPNEDYKGNLGWSFPKGWLDDVDGGVEPGPKAKGEVLASKEEIQEAAEREVREEGGVQAKVVTKLATLKIFFSDEGEKVMKFVTYFVMEFEREVPEGFGWETEEVRWVDLGEAVQLLAFKNEQELIKQAATKI